MAICRCWLLRQVNKIRLLRCQHLFILLTCVSFLVAIYFSFNVSYKHELPYLPLNLTFAMIEDRLRQSILEDLSLKCNPPKLKFLKQVVKSQDNSKVTCEGDDWVQCNLSKCYLNEKILKTVKDITCVYEDVFYYRNVDVAVNKKKFYLGLPVELRGNKTYFFNSSDHVKVSCIGQEVKGFGIVSSRWYGYKAGFRPSVSQTHSQYTRKLDISCLKLLNILLIAIDSTSQNRFLQQMPKSQQVLNTELEATFFQIHNVVGNGTPATMFPVLIGKSEIELSDLRTGTPKYIDEKHFIYQILKMYGYRTAYLEDMTFKDAFPFQFNSFRQPVDHYLKTLFIDAKENGPTRLSGLKNSQCIGGVSRHQYLLDLTKQFFEQPGSHFCVTTLSEVNNNADDDLASFFQYFKQSERIQDTLMFVVGVQGSSFVSNPDAYLRNMEQRLPLMAVVIPENLQRCRPRVKSSLEINANVLTTHFDIHTTMLDALGIIRYRNKYKVPVSEFDRGMSLLRFIPWWRSCGEAGILPYWCVCTKWINVFKQDRMYKLVTNEVVRFINDVTKIVRKFCAAWELTSVVWVKKQVFNDRLLKNKMDEVDDELLLPKYDVVEYTREHYQAKICMSKTAYFVGEVTYFVDMRAFEVLESDISRVDSLKDESACVNASYPHLSKFCKCKQKYPYKKLNVHLETDIKLT